MILIQDQLIEVLQKKLTQVFTNHDGSLDDRITRQEKVSEVINWLEELRNCRPDEEESILKEG